MDIPTQDQLIANLEAFCARHDMAETRFGREAVNNPNLLRGLREGKSPTLETLGRVEDFMARTDERARLRAKLDAPPTLTSDEEDIPLPFSQAPVSPTGGSSPTSSPTTAPVTSSQESASCPACSGPVDGAARPNPSCSAERVDQ